MGEKRNVGKRGDPGGKDDPGEKMTQGEKMCQEQETTQGKEMRGGEETTWDHARRHWEEMRHETKGGGNARYWIWLRGEVRVGVLRVNYDL